MSIGTASTSIITFPASSIFEAMEFSPASLHTCAYSENCGYIYRVDVHSAGEGSERIQHRCHFEYDNEKYKQTRNNAYLQCQLGPVLPYYNRQNYGNYAYTNNLDYLQGYPVL
jgi:hypothetical protein